MDSTAHKDTRHRAKTIKEDLRSCRLCPRNCCVDRCAGERGYCGLDDKARCFREMLHHGEERQLIPSHQVYFAGCNLRCGFCTVAEWNETPAAADEMNMTDLAHIIEQRRQEGAKTLNLLGGEPAVSLYGILELLGHLNSKIVVVWNSNMYYNAIVDEALRGLVGVFLADLKCYDCECSETILGASDYPQTATRNILKACEHADVILRFPLLPGHFDCCLRPGLNWVAETVPDVKVSLRGDYIPPAGGSRAPKEYLSVAELDMAAKAAQELGLSLIQ